jgi:hypothetical protein
MAMREFRIAMQVFCILVIFCADITRFRRAALASASLIGL